VFGIRSHIVPRNFAGAFRGSQSTDAQNFAQIAVALAIGWPDDQSRTIDGIEFASDDERERKVFGGRMGANDARERVSVTDRKSSISKEVGLLDKLLGVRGTFEKGEVRFAMEFDVGRHT
jgi:hypothetical protein